VAGPDLAGMGVGALDTAVGGHFGRRQQQGRKPGRGHSILLAVVGRGRDNDGFGGKQLRRLQEKDH
jgi:hypothetical protein